VVQNLSLDNVAQIKRRISEKLEMNLMEFPFVVANRKLSKKLQSIEVRKQDLGTGAEICWTVTGSAKFGLPVPSDADYLYVVISEARKHNSPRIPITPHHILTRLSIQPGKAEYQSVIRGLQRLLSTTIISEGLWHDHRTGKKISLKRGFHLIASYSFRSTFDEAGQEEFGGFSYIELAREVFSSIKAGYLKSVDWDAYLSLPGYLPRRCYLYLLKKAGNKKEWEVNLSTLRDFLGLSPDRELRKVRYDLEKKGLPPLKTIGFLRDWEWKGKGSAKLWLQFEKPLRIEERWRLLQERGIQGS